MTFIEEELETLERNPDYKKFLKVYIKYQIHMLVQKLSDVGEESFLVTASVNDGTFSHVGSNKGEVFLDRSSDLTWKFLSFCSSTDQDLEALQSEEANFSASESTEMPNKDTETMESGLRGDSQEDEMQMFVVEDGFDENQCRISVNSHYYGTHSYDDSAQPLHQPRFRHAHKRSGNVKRRFPTNLESRKPQTAIKPEVDPNSKQTFGESTDHVHRDHNPESIMYAQQGDGNSSEDMLVSAFTTGQHTPLSVKTVEKSKMRCKALDREDGHVDTASREMEENSQSDMEGKQNSRFRGVRDPRTRVKTEPDVSDYDENDTQNRPRSRYKTHSGVTVSGKFFANEAVPEIAVVNYHPVIVDQAGSSSDSLATDYSENMTSDRDHGTSVKTESQTSFEVGQLELSDVENVGGIYFSPESDMMFVDDQADPGLGRHSGQQTDGRQCKICGKVFSQSCYMKRHMMIHTGERPYNCSVCKKGFIKNSDLIKHMGTHSGKNNVIQCPVCFLTFSRYQYVTQHMKLHPVL